MVKKLFHCKLSDEDLKFILQHGKGKTEAIENILKRLRALEQNQPQHPQSHVPTQPNVVYRDRIVEKPVYIEKVVETIVEKPAGIVEKQVFVLEDDWLPEYWPFDSMKEYKTLMFEGEA